MEFRDPPQPFSLPMHHELLEWCLEVIGWSRGELARRLDISDTSAKGMVSGSRNIPNRVAVWVHTLASLHLAQPTPYLWHGGKAVGRERHGYADESWDEPGSRMRTDEDPF